LKGLKSFLDENNACLNDQSSVFWEQFDLLLEMIAPFGIITNTDIESSLFQMRASITSNMLEAFIPSDRSEKEFLA